MIVFKIDGEQIFSQLQTIRLIAIVDVGFF